MFWNYVKIIKYNKDFGYLSDDKGHEMYVKKEEI